MISIVITAYNVEEYIETALRSAIEQTYEDREIIVVEDCSTDNTRKVLERIVNTNPEVKVIYNEKNVGAGMSRRIGITASSGDFVITLDGDDWISKYYLQELHDKQLETGAEIVSGGVTIVRESGESKSYGYGERVIVGGEKLSHFYSEKVVFMNNKIVSRRLHDLVPYCERRYIEDTPVIAPMLYLANKVAYTGNSGYFYRMRGSSLTHTADGVKSNLYTALCMADLVDFFKDKGDYYRKMFSINEFKKYVGLLIQAKPQKEEVERYKEDWRNLWLYASNHLNDNNEAMTCPPMFVVNRKRGVCFLNTFNPYLKDLKKVLLRDLGYPAENDHNVASVLPVFPNACQVLVEDMNLWERENGAIRKVAVECSPVINVAYVWTKYIVGNEPHSVFGVWKKHIRTGKDFLKLLEVELQKPVCDQVEELRNDKALIDGLSGVHRVDVNELKVYLSDNGFPIPDDAFVDESYGLPEEMVDRVNELYGN